MYRTVIWATDGSAEADSALPHARRLAGRDGGIVAVHCDQHMFRAARTDADVRPLQLRALVNALRSEGVPIELIVRHTNREAADEVAEAAAELHADVIVCGTRGLGALAGAFLGSFTRRLLQIAPCPVLAVPALEPVLEPVDDEPRLLALV